VIPDGILEKLARDIDERKLATFNEEDVRRWMKLVEDVEFDPDNDQIGDDVEFGS
jgi:hypothetical protein